MKDIIRMQQLAGIITEGQARKMMQILNESQSLNERILDSSRLKTSGEKSVKDYVLDNNLGSIKDIFLSGSRISSNEASLTFTITLSTGKEIKITTQFDGNYNLIDIKPEKSKPTTTISGTPIPNKIKGVKINIEGNDITFSGRSGEYIGDINADGTISLELFYGDEEEGEEFDQYNWKDILGPNHVFVRIANSIPTKVEALGDSLGINFKASDVINMN